MPKGSGVPHTREGRLDHPRPAARDRREEDGRPQRQRRRARPRRSSPAPPGRWASPSRTDVGRTVDGRSWEGRAAARQRPQENQTCSAARATARPPSRSTATKLYTPAEAIKLAKETSHRQVRRDGRGRHAPRRRPAQGRPDGPRHGQPAARHRQDRPRDRLRRRREGRRGRGRRCRRGRHRRAGRPDPGGLAGLRRRDRHAGPDGQDRPDRADPGPARPHAEPEDRHGHHGRHQGGRGHQGRQDHLPGGQALQPAPDHRQGVVHGDAAGRQLRRGARRGAAGQAVRGQGQVPQEGHRHHHDGPGHPGRPERDPQPARASPPRPSRSTTSAHRRVALPVASADATRFARRGPPRAPRSSDAFGARGSVPSRTC